MNEIILWRDHKRGRAVLSNENNESATHSEEEFVITLTFCFGSTATLTASRTQQCVSCPHPPLKSYVNFYFVLPPDFTVKTSKIEVSKSS
jgi:hypothetical protein